MTEHTFALALFYKGWDVVTGESGTTHQEIRGYVLSEPAFFQDDYYFIYTSGRNIDYIQMRTSTHRLA